MLARTFMLLFVAVSAVATAWADNVSEAEALQKAQAFLQERGKVQATQLNGLHPAAMSRGSQAQTGTCSKYYLFNVGEGDGFVIVSGDDRTTAILGYADSGSISEDDMPNGLRYLLDCYAKEIEMMDALGIDGSNTAAMVRRNTPARTSISPMIVTRWNQGKPYNNDCPLICDERSATGCVATSMAQLMYHHKWPQGDCTSLPAYDVTTKDKDKNNYSLHVDGLPATSFNWGVMTTTYSTTDEGDAATAVAKLMKYCGVSLHMKYGLSSNGGSSAYNPSIAEALKENFGYDSGIKFAQRKNYTYTEWIELLYNELATGRPLIMGGQSAGGGHSFVCDGYDADDYFHFNWGWGGSSDGYYRLSLLQPWEQGIGGSSTLDGFTFGQDAVLGIQKPTGSSPEYCLTVEGLTFYPNTNATSQTYTRTSTADPFTGIGLHILLCSYQFGTNNYDFAFQLIDESGTVVEPPLLEVENKSITFNTDYSDNPSLSIPASVGNGTYYIRVVSRTAGTTTWKECNDGEQCQLTAVISGNDLTVSVPVPTSVKPASADIAVNGNLKVGYEQEVVATVTGGSGDYNSQLFLYVDNILVMGKTVEIAAGETADVRFAYTPSTSGTNELKITTARSTSPSYVIGSTSVTIGESDATDNLVLTLGTPVIENLLEPGDGKQYIYCNSLRTAITVENPSITNSYSGKIQCTVYKWRFWSDEHYLYSAADPVTHKTLPFTLDKNSQAEVKFAFDGLESGEKYSIKIIYLQNGTSSSNSVEAGRDPSYNNWGCLIATDGYRTTNADGTVSLHPASATIDAGTAAVVDMRGLNDVSGVTVTAGSNPNCLFLLPDGATTPASLNGLNVVCDGTAANLTLTDGYDFYSPIDFTATNVSYTRTFDLAANGTSGWNVIMLPFDVTSVKVDNGTSEGKAIDWFHSATDTGKHFWLRAFTGDGKGTVTFDYANEMSANTPYIIAVPDARFGAEWQITGKAVTFTGTNAAIAPTSTVSVSGNNYRFSGSTVGSTISNVYLLNAVGSAFEKTASPTSVDAFRAWFNPVNISTLNLPTLAIGSPGATGIDILTHTTKGEGSGYFTLDGRKLSGKPTARGMYIYNGKTIIIR